MAGIIGIDTSCYTTSLAVVDEMGSLCSDRRCLLEVGAGERGLRQSEAFFRHVSNLPELATALRQDYSGRVAGVAATGTPRPVKASYLPVFQAGFAWGRSLASLLDIPFLATTHQENHIRAGVWSAGGPSESGFLAVHLSGGTTEFLLVEGKKGGYEIAALGRSQDLHAGQFIDRLGVSLGLAFPAGAELEQLALRGQRGRISISASVKDCNVSFSGPLTSAQRFLAEGARPEDVALAAFYCVAKTVEKVLRPLLGNIPTRDILFVGGVSANGILRQRLQERLEHRAVGGRLFFAQPEFCTDNAVGTALLGRDYLQAMGL